MLGVYHKLQGGNMNGSDAHPASTVNKITWPRYVTLDSLISSSILAGWASDPFMLPPCMPAADWKLEGPIEARKAQPLSSSKNYIIIKKLRIQYLYFRASSIYTLL